MSKIIYDVIQRFEVENGVPRLISTNIQVIEGGEDLMSLAANLLKQLGFDDKNEKHSTKAALGHFKKAGTVAKKKVVEFQDFATEQKLGDLIDVSIFSEGEFVDVQGVSKGKGFQGVVKRHGFGGVGQATHGQHNRLRAPGSVGASSYPSRVFKGMRMAGRMGGDNVKVQNLRVLKVVADKNLLVIKGCVPGHNNSYVIIQK